MITLRARWAKLRSSFSAFREALFWSSPPGRQYAAAMVLHKLMLSGVDATPEKDRRSTLDQQYAARVAVLAAGPKKIDDKEAMALLRLALRVAVKFETYEVPPRDSVYWRSEFGDLVAAIPRLDKAVQTLRAAVGEEEYFRPSA